MLFKCIKLFSLYSWVGDMWFVFISWWVIVEVEEILLKFEIDFDIDFCFKEFKRDDGFFVYLLIGCLWIFKILVKIIF